LLPDGRGMIGMTRGAMHAADDGRPYSFRAMMIIS
jgi:hypothetical protein